MAELPLADLFARLERTTNSPKIGAQEPSLTSPQASNLSATDLAASFAPNAQVSSPATPTPKAPGHSSLRNNKGMSTVGQSSSSNPQDMLLSLLKQASNDRAASSTPPRVFGANGQTSPFEPHVQPTFTYTNPFNTLPPPPEPTAPTMTASQEAVVDNWESADVDEKPSESPDTHVVQVYSLPMRPFVSLTVSGSTPPASKIRPDAVMKISSLKKEFNQIDRMLATASPNHIVYVMAKGGGFRVIRQDDGSSKTVFRQPQNQIFNVAISSASGADADTVLATGHNGSIYWTSVPSRTDLSFEELDKRSFVFPPPPPADENTTNTLLKTRAKQSSRHPEFFAMGRGKNIYLVWPAVAQSNAYLDGNSRVVDSMKYLADDSIKISTGKASKDFTFSEDDTCIVSLDKTGNIKFWDISKQVERNNEFEQTRKAPVEISEPVMTLATSSVPERASPSSVQLVDKERPTTKGTAFRYMLVGLAQNHTIQLWDLGLGKVVQELNLPHAHETDAICSIAYHAKSGIISVGHPTRNSLYLIHLSAPKYNLPSVSQAKYINSLVGKEKALARPDSTAIMSGIREISLASIGSLRSMDVVASTQATQSREQEGETVFEVYLMHSRGVHYLNLKYQDLGWGKDGKVAGARDGQTEGLVTVSELGQKVQKSSGSIPETPESTASNSETQKTSVSTTEPQKRPASIPDRKKPSTSIPEVSQETSSKTEPTAAPEVSATRQPETDRPTADEVTPKTEIASKAEVIPKTEDVTPLQNGLGASPPTATTAAPHDITQHFDKLYARLEEDKRVAEAAGAARQDAVLRLVSSTLTENVEKSLTRIVSTAMHESLLPKISQDTTGALSTIVSRDIHAILPKVLDQALAGAALKEAVSSACVAATRGTERHVGELHERLKRAEAQTQLDAAKIEQLTSTTERLYNNLTSFRTETKELLASLASENRSLREVVRAPSERSAVHTGSLSAEQTELAGIADDMQNGRLEQGTVKWLQSNSQIQYFDELFVRVNPTYIASCNQIVILSVAAAVSVDLTKNLSVRLQWLETALSAADPCSAETNKYSERLMDVIHERMVKEYMRLHATDSGGAGDVRGLLGRIHAISEQAKAIKAAVGGT